MLVLFQELSACLSFLLHPSNSKNKNKNKVRKLLLDCGMCTSITHCLNASFINIAAHYPTDAALTMQHTIKTELSN